MTNDITPIPEAEVVLYQPDDNIRLDVRIEDETVWLSQMQMSDLFATTKQNISLHIANIFREGELQQNVVVKDFFTTTPHGAIKGKTQRKKLKLYNLDVIISVGYRVKSQRGTQFRIWATGVLKQYLLQGYTINRQLVALQERVDNRFSALEQRIDKHEDQISFFIRTNQPPIEGVFYEGQVLDARDFAETLIKSAQREVLLIDNYIDARTFEILEVRNPNVTAAIYVERIGMGLRNLQQTSQTQTERQIDLRQTAQRMHDRFLIIDDTVYHLGASLKEPREQREQYQAYA